MLIRERERTLKGGKFSCDIISSSERSEQDRAGEGDDRAEAEERLSTFYCRIAMVGITTVWICCCIQICDKISESDLAD